MTEKNIICENCKKEFKINEPKVCFECSFIRSDWTIITSKEIDSSPKGSRWYKSKLFLYQLLLYGPISLFIGLNYGLSYEIVWVLGGVYLAMIKTMSDYLNDIF